MSSKYSYQEIKEIIKVFDNESSDLFFFSFNIKKKKKKKTSVSDAALFSVFHSLGENDNPRYKITI